MNYDIVLATRNRRSVLNVSIPLMLSQSRQPTNFILVDSSDDHQSIARSVREIFSAFRGQTVLKLIESKPGTAVQRNVGLNYVESEIVMFPDDDALWYPGYAESIMSIYEMDREQLIGGVPGDQANTPPPTASIQASLPYSMTLRDRINLLFSKPLRRLELLPFMRETAFLEGDNKIRGKPVPKWLEEKNAQLVGPMTGFTMSFRKSSIVVHKFDENLGRYALFEDYDASLQVMETKIIVKAKGAKVFHYKSPEKRTNGFEWGTIMILNRAYIICKAAPPGSSARRYLIPYSVYKCIRYLAQCQSSYGRQRFKGAFYALRHVRGLLSSPPEGLVAAFLGAREECLKHAKKGTA